MSYNENNRGMVSYSTPIGRTRSPKNINGSNSTAEAATLAAAPDPGSVANIAKSFSTSNQRFLHLLLDTSVKNNANGDGTQNVTITVHGFSHALNRWAPIKDRMGNDITIAANGTSSYQIFEISGLDRVCFVSSPALAEGNFFFAATSTF
jgi:hypothetical protein